MSDHTHSQSPALLAQIHSGSMQNNPLPALLNTVRQSWIVPVDPQASLLQTCRTSDTEAVCSRQIPDPLGILTKAMEETWDISFPTYAAGLNIQME